MIEALKDPNFIQNFLSDPTNVALMAIALLVIIALKLTSLWISARNDQKAWFIILGIVNTIGILEIIYLIFFSKRQNKI